MGEVPAGSTVWLGISKSFRWWRIARKEKRIARRSPGVGQASPPGMTGKAVREPSVSGWRVLTVTNRPLGRL